MPPRIYSGSDGSVPVGAVIDVSSSSGQDAAMGLIGSVEWILITCDNADDYEDGKWIMIPAENLVSASRGTGTKIAARVRHEGEVGGLASALQLGVDALCVSSSADGGLWDAVVTAREDRGLQIVEGGDDGGDDPKTEGPTIVAGTCGRIETPNGRGSVLADRVCIDLVRSLSPNEGCWVGSSAKCTALVLSEAAESSFVPSRPFRINAGPVHSYVVMGDGTSTKYLSELRPGDEVLVYDVSTGLERSVAVGRLKVEVRPCVMVGLRAGSAGNGEISGQVFLQQAETVRLGQRLGDTAFVRATDLSDGDVDEGWNEVLLRVASSGTHVGKAYAGKVTEK